MVEFLGSPHEPDRALLDQVEERQTAVAVFLRDRDDEAQICLDDLLFGEPIATLDALSELHFLRRRQELDLANGIEEERQRIGRRLQRPVVFLP